MPQARLLDLELVFKALGIYTSRGCCQGARVKKNGINVAREQAAPRETGSERQEIAARDHLPPGFFQGNPSLVRSRNIFQVDPEPSEFFDKLRGDGSLDTNKESAGQEFVVKTVYRPSYESHQSKYDKPLL
jgi:hypothetical protein